MPFPRAWPLFWMLHIAVVEGYYLEEHISECEWEGQILVNRDNRCKFIHCGLSAHFGERGTHLLDALVKDCPYGTRVPMKLYQEGLIPGMVALCTEVVKVSDDEDKNDVCALPQGRTLHGYYKYPTPTRTVEHPIEITRDMPLHKDSMISRHTLYDERTEDRPTYSKGNRYSRAQKHEWDDYDKSTSGGPFYNKLHYNDKNYLKHLPPSDINYQVELPSTDRRHLPPSSRTYQLDIPPRTREMNYQRNLLSPITMERTYQSHMPPSDQHYLRHMSTSRTNYPKDPSASRNTYQMEFPAERRHFQHYDTRSGQYSRPYNKPQNNYHNLKQHGRSKYNQRAKPVRKQLFSSQPEDITNQKYISYNPADYRKPNIVSSSFQLAKKSSHFPSNNNFYHGLPNYAEVKKHTSRNVKVAHRRPLKHAQGGMRRNFKNIPLTKKRPFAKHQSKSDLAPLRKMDFSHNPFYSLDTNFHSNKYPYDFPDDQRNGFVDANFDTGPMKNLKNTKLQYDNFFSKPFDFSFSSKNTKSDPFNFGSFDIKNDVFGKNLNSFGKSESSINMPDKFQPYDNTFQSQVSFPFSNTDSSRDFYGADSSFNGNGKNAGSRKLRQNKKAIGLSLRELTTAKSPPTPIPNTNADGKSLQYLETDTNQDTVNPLRKYLGTVSPWNMDAYVVVHTTPSPSVSETNPPPRVAQSSFIAGKSVIKGKDGPSHPISKHKPNKPRPQTTTPSGDVAYRDISAFGKSSFNEGSFKDYPLNGAGFGESSFQPGGFRNDHSNWFGSNEYKDWPKFDDQFWSLDEFNNELGDLYGNKQSQSKNDHGTVVQYNGDHRKDRSESESDKFYLKEFKYDKNGPRLGSKTLIKNNIMNPDQDVSLESQLLNWWPHESIELPDSELGIKMDTITTGPPQNLDEHAQNQNQEEKLLNTKDALTVELSESLSSDESDVLQGRRPMDYNFNNIKLANINTTNANVTLLLKDIPGYYKVQKVMDKDNEYKPVDTNFNPVQLLPRDRDSSNSLPQEIADTEEVEPTFSFFPRGFKIPKESVNMALPEDENKGGQ